MRARHPNRIGANPVAAKTSALAPRKGRLSNNLSGVHGGVAAGGGPLYPQAPGGGFEPNPGQIVRPSTGPHRLRPDYERPYYTVPYTPHSGEGSREPIPPG